MMLAELLRTLPVGIEIVPGDGTSLWPLESGSNPNHPFILIDEHLAVPSKALYAAYLQGISSLSSAKDDANIADASSIILLANPDHNTALNRRKQLVLRGVLSESFELSLTATLLSVPRNSKSSLLWHHRLWLFRRIYPLTTVPSRLSDIDIFPMLPVPHRALVVEISLTERAAAAYPRNYYAWNHRFICLQRAVFAAAAETGVNDDTAVDSESLEAGSVNPNLKRQQNQWRVFIQDEYTRMKRWTDSHVSDFTSMQYLAQVIHAHLQLTLPLSPSLPAGCADQEHEGSYFHATDEPPALSHVLSLLRAYPSHEAIWMCLRQVFTFLAEGKQTDDLERAKLARNIYAWLPGHEEDDNAHERGETGEHDVGSEEAKIRSGGGIGTIATTTLASEFAQAETRQTSLIRKRFVDHIAYLGRKREGR